MRRWCIVLLLLASGVGLLPGTGWGDEPKPRPVRILWAGSSSTYYHDLPSQTTRWVNAAGVPAASELVGRSGDGIHVYRRPDFDRYEYGVKKGQTFLEKVRDEKFDLVVLQVVTTFITGKEAEEHEKAIDEYCRAIRAAGGEPVFYEMGWNSGEAGEQGRQKIFEAAVRNKVTRFAPCASAWARVRKERPDLELHNPPDRTHPGTLGGYLNLCCFFAALSGKDPSGRPAEFRAWRRLTDQEKAEAGKRLEPSPFDDYVGRLPRWMQVNSVMAWIEKLEPKTAAYLQTVAGDTWRDTRKRLAERIRPDEGASAFQPQRLADPTGLPDTINRHYQLLVPKSAAEGTGANYPLVILELRYAAKESRPTQLLLNGNLEDMEPAAEVTGDWTPRAQRRFLQGVYRVKAGRNALTFHREGPVPLFDK